jgi:hypothetical protein
VLATSGQRADQLISCSAALDILTADVQVIVVRDVVVIHPCYLPVAPLKLLLFQVSHIDTINDEKSTCVFVHT